MNALARSEVTALAVMPEEELIAVLESSLYPGAQPQSIKMVLGYCKASGLDPMQKPVHIVPIWDGKAKRMRDAIMPGIGLYRTQAARTGQLAGISEAEFGPMITETLGGTQITYPEWARVVVKRILPSGHIAEYEAREYWIENYATAGRDTAAPNTMWKKRTRGQVAKCAEAQALRKGFPEAVGSQPTAEEMEGKTQYDEERTIDMPTGARATPAPTATPAAPPWPADLFALRLPEWRAAIAAGRASADAVIAKARAKHPLTEEQEQAIRKKDEATDAMPKVTYAQVAEKLHAAQDLEHLANAASLIAAVGDEGQRKELGAIYDERSASLNN